MLGFHRLGFETVKSVIHPNVDVVLFGGTAAFLELILHLPHHLSHYASLDLHSVN
jgi:hypothetical protein